MGIVQKQTLKGLIYSYTGVLVGFLNMGILAPNIFSPEQIGLKQVIYSIAILLGQVGNLGFVEMSNRIFPWFRDSRNDNRGFFGLGLIITAAGTLFVVVLLLLNLDHVVASQTERSLLLEEHSGLIPLMLILIIWVTFFDNYVKVQFNAALGTLLRDLVVRIVNLLLIILFFSGVITFDAYMLLYVINQGLPSIVVLLIYLGRRGELAPGRFWLFVDRKMARQLLSLSAYGLVTGISAVALYALDKVLVNYYIGLEMAGIYTISFYFGTIIMIPGRSLAKIAIPVAADAWKRNDLFTIGDLYRRSCLNQVVVGSLLVTGIVANLDNIYRILPEAYAGGGAVIVLISISNFINNATGASVSILGTSAYYHYHTWLMLLLTILVVAANALLIPVMGLTGAALASVIAVVITSGLRVFIIYRKTGLWPYGWSVAAIIIISALIYAGSLLIPSMPLIPDIVLRSGVITLIFGAAIYYFRLSDDIRLIIDQAVAFIRERTG